MIISAPHVYRIRRADVTVSDLTSSVEIAPREWGRETFTLTFDVEPSASEQESITTRLTTENPNEETLFARAKQAVITNNEFLAKPSPSNAEVVAQVKFLTRCVSMLIRLVLRWLDAAD